MEKSSQKRIVFFDLDGTLHRQDIFGSFILYLLLRQPFNLFLLLPLLPIVIFGFLIKGRAARWPMSLLLWSLTFAHSKDVLVRREVEFSNWFKKRIISNSIVKDRLKEYLSIGNVDVWVITGSPKSLVDRIYFDSSLFREVNIIASQMKSGLGGLLLIMRCLGEEKVIQLKKRIGSPLKLYSGYSDSKQDDPLLFFCENRWRVTSSGELRQL